jgi:hypothetical protein
MKTIDWCTVLIFVSQVRESTYTEKLVMHRIRLTYIEEKSLERICIALEYFVFFIFSMFKCNKWNKNIMPRLSIQLDTSLQLTGLFLCWQPKSPFHKTCSIVPYIYVNNDITGQVTLVFGLVFYVTIWRNVKMICYCVIQICYLNTGLKGNQIMLSSRPIHDDDNNTLEFLMHSRDL